MREYQKHLKEARNLLRQGNAQEAFKTLRPVLRYPGMVGKKNELVEALTTLADIGARIVGDEFAAVVRNVVLRPESDQALYRLGYELIEQGLADIAATILAHAHRLYPGSADILNELSAALEHEGLYGEARTFLRNAPELVTRHFLCCYLLAFTSLMSGDLETPQRLLPDLQRLQVQDERFASVTGRIVSMLRRADALAKPVPLSSRDLRGWHFVITAGLLLHLSPHGFEEGMNGRYAFVQDRRDFCLEGIRKVQSVLEALHISLPHVFALPERNSLILAHACARVLNLPLEHWPAGGSTTPGLLVAYDLALLDGDLLSTLAQHRSRQILWQHASCWTEEQPVAADLCTFLYQFNTPPWGEVLAVKPGEKTVSRQPADERDPAVIGEEVASATLTPESLEDVPTLVNFVQAAAGVSSGDGLALLRTMGRREKQWLGSPVPSSHFA